MSDQTKVYVAYGAATVASLYAPAYSSYFFGAASVFAAIVTQPGSVSGPKINDVNYSGSAFGQPIMRGWGTFPTSPIYIWAPPLREIEKEESSKGGGPEYIYYQYKASFAILLCEGPVDAVRRIWFDTRLVYDASDTNTGLFKWKKLKIAIYLGDSTQVADPTIESYEGVGNVPGWRGYCYFVVDDLPLEKFGNRRPNVRAEVVKNASSSDSTASIGTDANSFDLRYSPSDDTIVSLDGTQINRWDPVSQTVISTSPLYTGFTSVYDVDPNDGTIYGVSHVDGNHWWPINRTPFEGGTETDYWPPDPPTDTTTPENYGQIAEIIYQEYDDTVAYIILTGVNATQLTFWEDHTTTEGVISSYTAENIIWYKIDGNGYAWASYSDTGTYDHIVTIDGDTYDLNSLFGISNPTQLQWHVPTQSMLVEHSGGIIRLSIDDSGGSPVLVNEGSISGVGLFYEQSKRWLYENQIWCTAGPSTFKKIDIPSMTLVDRPSIVFSIISGDQVYHPATNTIWTGKQSSSNTWVITLDRIPPGTETLPNVVSELARDLDSSNVDVTNLSGTVDGFVVTAPEPTRNSISRLFPTHKFSSVESDGTVKYVHVPGSSVVTVPEDELAAHKYGSKTPSQAVITREQEIFFPKRVELTYLSREREYEGDTQSASKQISPSTRISKVELSEVLTADLAKQTAEVLLHVPRDERSLHEFKLGNKYLYLEPMDEIELTKGSTTFRVRLSRTDWDGNIISARAISTDPASFTSNASGIPSDFQGTVIENIRNSLAWLMDLPLLSGLEDIYTPGFYAGVTADEGSWDGATLHRASAPDSTDTAQLATMTVEITAGYAEDVLADTSDTTTWDTTNTVTIQMTEGTLASVTDADVLNGENAAALGSEIIQFVNVTDNGDGTYTLNRLLRGRRGTEWATGDHKISDQFVLLNQETIYNVYTTISTSGVEHFYRAVTFELSLFESFVVPFTNNNVRLKPFSPVHPTGSYDGTDVTLGATRRTRVFINPEYTVIPLGETIEEYELDITDSTGTVLRTITGLTSLSYTYLNADIQTDYGMIPGIIYGCWYQLSGETGRGYPLCFDTSELIGILPLYTDFSSYTAGQTASDWVPYGTGWNINCLVTADTSQYSYAATGNWLEFDGGAAFSALGYWDIVPYHADMDVLVEFDNTNTGGFDQVLLLRNQLPDSYKHYGLGYDQSSTTIEFRYKTSAGGWNTSGYTGTRTYVLAGDLSRPAKTYYRYRIIGNHHYAKVWQTSVASEPASWQLDATHDSILTAGNIGFVIGAASATWPISRIAIAYDGDIATF